MKKNALLFSILSIIILTVALTFALLDALIPINFLIHPILNFLLLIFVGFGVLFFAKGVSNNSHWFLFISNLLLSLALLYLTVTCVKWWLSVLIVFVFSAIYSIIAYCFCGNIEQVADNKKEGYLTYEQKKSFKEEDCSSQELPEIKSFK